MTRRPSSSAPSVTDSLRTLHCGQSPEGVGAGLLPPDDEDPLALIQRSELELEARRYADSLGYGVNWDAVARLDDESLVNGIAQIAPLDVGSKQALLEADGLADRADLLVQFMQFQRMAPGGADGPQTMQ